MDARYASLAVMAEMVDDAERTRIATENRLRALSQTFGEAAVALPEWGVLESLSKTLEGVEATAVKTLEKNMQRHPLGPFVARTVGLGYKQTARLLAAIGDPATREMPSQLWRYCGLHVDNGQTGGDTQRTAAGHKKGDTQVLDAGQGSSDPHTSLAGQDSVDTHIARAGQDVPDNQSMCAGPTACGHQASTVGQTTYGIHSANAGQRAFVPQSPGAGQRASVDQTESAGHISGGSQTTDAGHVGRGPRRTSAGQIVLDTQPTAAGQKDVAAYIDHAGMGQDGRDTRTTAAHAKPGAHHTSGGVAPRLRRGERCSWSSAAKMRVFLCAESCVKQLHSPYRVIYEQGREKYANAIHNHPCPRCGPKGKPAPVGSPLSKGHQDARAKRLVMKAILLDLWRESRTLAGHSIR